MYIFNKNVRHFAGMWSLHTSFAHCRRRQTEDISFQLQKQYREV